MQIVLYLLRTTNSFVYKGSIQISKTLDILLHCIFSLESIANNIMMYQKNQVVEEQDLYVIS